MSAELELRYRNMGDDGLLAIIHSGSFRLDAQRLARRLILERGLSEDVIKHWRDPNAVLAAPLSLNGESEPKSTPIFFWRTPLRTLFLRPFGLPDSGNVTRNFARRYLSWIGHTYTLSDTEIKPWQEGSHLFKFLMLVIGVSAWIVLWHPRPSFNVRYPEDVPRLLDYMCRGAARSISWTFWDKIFKITCTQESWKRVVQYLINVVDLIVVDLSNGGEGLKWELDELLFYKAIGKTVFVARENGMNSAKLFLKSCGLSEPSQQVFAYREDGLAAKHEALKAALASVVG